MSDSDQTRCKRCDQDLQVSWTTGLKTNRAFIPRHKAKCGQWCMPKSEGAKWGQEFHRSIESCSICRRAMDDKRSEKEKLAAFGIDLDSIDKPKRPPGRPLGTGGARVTPPEPVRLAPSKAALEAAEQRRLAQAGAAGVDQVHRGLPAHDAVAQTRANLEGGAPDVSLRDADGRGGSQTGSTVKPKATIADYIKVIEVLTPLVTNQVVSVEIKTKAYNLAHSALDKLAALLD